MVYEPMFFFHYTYNFFYKILKNYCFIYWINDFTVRSVIVKTNKLEWKIMIILRTSKRLFFNVWKKTNKMGRSWTMNMKKVGKVKKLLIYWVIRIKPLRWWWWAGGGQSLQLQSILGKKIRVKSQNGNTSTRCLT